MTEGGVDKTGTFRRQPWLDDAGLAEIFAREVLRLLVDSGLPSPEWAERILSWRHTGFNVHSRVRARTKTEAEWIGKYMVRPVLGLERLSFLEGEGKVGPGGYTVKVSLTNANDGRPTRPRFIYGL